MSRRCEEIQFRSPLRALVLFHEYFHGETGHGLGASHQTGWTALAARVLENAAESSSPSGAADKKANLGEPVTSKRLKDKPIKHFRAPREVLDGVQVL